MKIKLCGLKHTIKKLPSSRKGGARAAQMTMTMMDMLSLRRSFLTEPELDAAYQLIQLSGDSAAAADSSKDDRSFEHLLPKDDAESVGDTMCSAAAAPHCDEISISSSSSSSTSAVINGAMIINAKNVDVCDQELITNVRSLKKRKFRSIMDLYVKTKPLVKKAAT